MVKIQSAPHGRQEGSLTTAWWSPTPASPGTAASSRRLAPTIPASAPAEIKIDTERAQAWIKSGAQPTDTVRALLKKVEVL